MIEAVSKIDVYIVLIGGIFAAISAIFVAYLRLKGEFKRELLRVSVETALHDSGKPLKYNGEDILVPTSSHVAFYYMMYKSLEEGKSPSEAVKISLCELKKVFQSYNESNIPLYASLPDLEK